jgi:hypothetical protein
MSLAHLINVSGVSPRGNRVSGASQESHWEAELRMLRKEIEDLRRDQQEMANSIRQLVVTFRSLATHLGIAAEPYAGKKKDERDVPGFA